jgi:hypothetical protein
LAQVIPCPRPLSTSTNAQDAKGGKIKFVYYDARREQFYYDNGDLVTRPLSAGEHLVLEVCHARFGEQFDFTLTEKSLPEVGAPVRGLEDVQGLIRGLPASPGAKGVGPLETVRFTPFADVSAVVARLHSLQDVVDLRTEIETDLASIRHGTTVMDEEYLRYRRAICQMTTQVLLADCDYLKMPLNEDTGLPPRVDATEIRLVRLDQEIKTASSFAAVPVATESYCPTTPSLAGGPPNLDRDQFICFVRHTNFIIRQFKSLRAMIQQPPLGSSAADLISELEEYKLRIFNYRKKLEQVRAAVEIEKVLIDTDPTILLTRLKKIQDSYKDVVTPEDIQSVAERQRGFVDSIERRAIKSQLDNLANRDGLLKRQSTALDDLAVWSNRRIDDVRNVDLHFGARVYQANKLLAQHIKELYRLYLASEVTPKPVEMFNWSGNTGVILAVKASDSFIPSDLDNLELPMETAGVEASINAPSPFAIPAPVPETTNAPALTAAAATPATTGTTSSTGGSNSTQSGAAQTPSSTMSTVSTSQFSAGTGPATGLEVHKTYRFNIAAGVLFSSVSQNNFVLRTVPVVDKNGNPSTNLVLASTGTDHVRVDFPVFLTTYLPKPLDLFTPSSANRVKFGTAVGFSTLDVTNNAYAGAFIQPTLGLDFIIGLHLARRNVPDKGIVPNVTVLDPNTIVAPFHQEWKPGFFVSMGFDALTFKKLFTGSN